MTQAVVLFSGGQDSTTCLYWAMARWAGEVRALSMYYGQRHAAELEAAREIAARAEVPLAEYDLSGILRAIGGSALVDDGELKASGGYVDEAMPEGLPTSFVPGRNALFLAVAASVAVKLGARNIVAGVCQTDFSGYPDCRREFVSAIERALTLAMPSSCGPLRIHTPLMDLSKAQTVMLAHNLGDEAWRALGRSVTCYKGQHPGCGTCAACVERAKGFAAARLEDPACAST
jgi:7-cyano-7-deazaguanine synthase